MLLFCFSKIQEHNLVFTLHSIGVGCLKVENDWKLIVYIACCFLSWKWSCPQKAPNAVYYCHLPVTNNITLPWNRGYPCTVVFFFPFVCFSFFPIQIINLRFNVKVNFLYWLCPSTPMLVWITLDWSTLLGPLSGACSEGAWGLPGLTELAEHQLVKGPGTPLKCFFVFW